MSKAIATLARLMTKLEQNMLEDNPVVALSSTLLLVFISMVIVVFIGGAIAVALAVVLRLLYGVLAPVLRLLF